MLPASASDAGSVGYEAGGLAAREVAAPESLDGFRYLKTRNSQVLDETHLRTSKQGA